MAGLLVPAHVARASRQTRGNFFPEPASARQTPTARTSLLPKAASLEEAIDAPIPEGHPIPLTHHMLLIQIGMVETTKGLVHLTDKLIADQTWVHGLCKLIAIGPDCYKSEYFDKCDRDQLPKVGQLFQVDVKAAGRIKRNGVLFHFVTDDQLKIRVDPQFADGYEYVGGLET